MSGPDGAQAALDALCERGISTLDDALAMADVLVGDDHDGDPGLLLDFGCDTIARLRDAVLRSRLPVVAIHAPDDTRAQAGECDVAAIGARAAAVLPDGAWDGYEGERAIAVVTEDVPALLRHIAAEPARVAAAVAGEREACAATCRDIASDAADDSAVSETADACAEAIDARAVRS